MLLHLQKFDIEVVNKKGTELYTVNTLSRAYLPTTSCKRKIDKEEVIFPSAVLAVTASVSNKKNL